MLSAEVATPVQPPECRLYLGDCGSGKTAALLQHYQTWLSQGVSSSQIVILAGHRLHHAALLRERLLSQLQAPLAELQIWIFPQWLRQFLARYASQLGPEPLICLQSSELLFLLRHFYAQQGLKYFEAPTQSTAFFQHLLRRYLRGIENHLSTDDLRLRSETLEISPQASQAQAFLQAFAQWLQAETPHLLDLGRQLQLLQTLLDLPAVQHDLQQYTHWLIDDLDETRPVEQWLYQKLTQAARCVIYAGNPRGGSERLLGAYPEYLQQMAQAPGMHVETLPAQAPLFPLADKVSSYVLRQPVNWQAAPALPVQHSQHLTGMYENMGREVQSLLAQGVPLAELVCVTWLLDAHSSRQLQAHFQHLQIPVEIYRGREALQRYPLVNALLSLLRLVLWPIFQQDSRLPALSGFDMAQIFRLCAGFSAFDLSRPRQQNQNNMKAWGQYLREQAEQHPDLGRLQQVVADLREANTQQAQPDLHALAQQLWQELLLPRLTAETPAAELAAVQQLFDVLQRQRHQASLSHSVAELMLQLLQQEVLEDSDLNLAPGASHLRIMTLYRLCELRCPSEYQLWFDISASAWNRPVNHPLDNALLLSPAWPLEREWDLAAEEQFTRERLACLIHKGLQYGRQTPLFFAAHYDAQARPQNFTLLQEILAAEAPEASPPQTAATQNC